ncbi:unnamed protein product, partial [Rotaria sordida]
MQFNQSIFSIQSWSLYDYQFIDFIQNQTISCPIKSKWLHFEEYLFTSIGLIITLMITFKIHLLNIRNKLIRNIFVNNIIEEYCIKIS